MWLYFIYYGSFIIVIPGIILSIICQCLISYRYKKTREFNRQLQPVYRRFKLIRKGLRRNGYRVSRRCRARMRACRAETHRVVFDDSPHNFSSDNEYRFALSRSRCGNRRYFKLFYQSANGGYRNRYRHRYVFAHDDFRSRYSARRNRRVPPRDKNAVGIGSSGKRRAAGSKKSAFGGRDDLRRVAPHISPLSFKIYRDNRHDEKPPQRLKAANRHDEKPSQRLKAANRHDEKSPQRLKIDNQNSNKPAARQFRAAGFPFFPLKYFLSKRSKQPYICRR